MLIANSNLVPKWADWDHFNELDRKGLMMYGQMTAGSWIYIGTQGIVQGTYETFAEMGRQHYDGDLRGPLDPDRRAWRHGRRAAAGGGDGRRPLHRHRMPGEPDRETARDPLSRQARDQHRRGARHAARAAGADLGRAARQCRRNPARDGEARHQARRAHRPDLGPRSGQRLSADRLEVEQWIEMRERDPKAVEEAARASMAVHVEAMLAFRAMGVPTFDYGNNIRQVAKDEGVTHAFDFPGFVPAYVRPLFCRGIGPFRWAALSGDPEDIYRTEGKVKELIPDDPHLHNWLDMARERIAFQGLPARTAGSGSGRGTGSASPSTTWWRRAN